MAETQGVERYQLNGLATGLAIGIPAAVVIGTAAAFVGILGSGSWAHGRRHAGLEGCEGRSEGTALGQCFASMAELEEASVPAFEHLARELTAHGAPERLVRAAVRSADEERRHARMMGALARRFGGRPRPVRVAKVPVRSLGELARENAVEGCVGETWGALQALWQARFSSDRAVRAVTRRVARDEARHAALAWGVDAWARERLSASEREGIAEARETAVASLGARAPSVPAVEDSRVLGLPEGLDAVRLFSLARAAVWDGAGA